MKRHSQWNNWYETMAIVAICQRYCRIASICYGFGGIELHIVAEAERDVGDMA